MSNGGFLGLFDDDDDGMSRSESAIRQEIGEMFERKQQLENAKNRVDAAIEEGKNAINRLPGFMMGDDPVFDAGKDIDDAVGKLQQALRTIRSERERTGQRLNRLERELQRQQRR